MYVGTIMKKCGKPSFDTARLYVTLYEYGKIEK